MPLARRANTLLPATFFRFTPPSSAPCTCATSKLVLSELFFDAPLSAVVLETRVFRAVVGVVEAVETGLVVAEEREVLWLYRDVVRSGGCGAFLSAEGVVRDVRLDRSDAGSVCRPNPWRTNFCELLGSAARSSVDPWRELVCERPTGGERTPPGMTGLAGRRDLVSA